MARHRENHQERNYGDDDIQAFLDELDLDWDDDFDHTRQKQARVKSKRHRDARRKIERYREDRDLEARLREYYDY